MSGSMGRRAFLHGIGSLLALGLAGCTKPEEAATPQADTNEHMLDDEQPDTTETSDTTDMTDMTDSIDQEEGTMQISVTINDVPFTATIEDTPAGQELLARLPLALQMEELHGNEKYCYTGQGFGGEQYVPETIEAGDLMVFGSDCLVLFYETFSNGGWSYARVGKIDDPSDLAEACGRDTVTVAFAALSA